MLTKLMQLVPFIIQEEMTLLKQEFNDKYVSNIFDGTTCVKQWWLCYAMSLVNGFTVSKYVISIVH